MRILISVQILIVGDDVVLITTSGYLPNRLLLGGLLGTADLMSVVVVLCLVLIHEVIFVLLLFLLLVVILLEVVGLPSKVLLLCLRLMLHIRVLALSTRPFQYVILSPTHLLLLHLAWLLTM